MNTFQLAQVLTKDPVTKEGFSGVYAFDQLSSIEINEYPTSFVVNTDPMELPGTHWISTYFNKQMKREFFDSYGKQPIHYDKHFLYFMNRNAVEWQHNKIQLQSAFSTVCGQYCIYFLYHRCGKRSMSSKSNVVCSFFVYLFFLQVKLLLLNSFVNDKLHNDQLVYDFVSRKYRQVHPSLKQDIVKQISRSLYRIYKI